MNDRPGSHPPQSPEELGFIRGLAEALAQREPLALLDGASAVAASVSEQPLDWASEREHPHVTLDGLIASFLEAGLRETDALLLVWSEMLEDDLLKRRILRAVGTRGHQMPGWLHRIGEVRPVRAVSVGHVLREQETIFLDIFAPDGAFTLAVAIEHRGLAAVEDAYTVPLGFAAALTEISLDRIPHTVRTELSLGDARARLAEALRVTAMTLPPLETETWPMSRPLLEWILRLMPEDGTGFERREWQPAEIEELARGLLASPAGAELSAEAAEHVELLLDFQANYGSGEPLIWGAEFVERVMCDLYPRKVLADPEFMRAMPGALRALIEYANERSGIPRVYTDEALDTVDDCLPVYLTRISDPEAPEAAILAGLPPGLGPDHPLANLNPLEPGSIERFKLDMLILEAGSEQTLDGLDATPLPVESLDQRGVPEDILPRVRQVALLLEKGAARYFEDPELTTVALRLLARVAAVDPTIFRRRSKNETAAAALCWIAGKNNAWFTAQGGRSRTVQALMQSFGLKGSPSQRAEPMLRALDPHAPFGFFEFSLGDPELLTSTRRREMIESRDELRTAIASTGEAPESDTPPRRRL